MRPGGSIPERAPGPEQWDLPSEPFTVTTNDGASIRGWFVPAAGPTRAAVVVCHGVGSSHWGAMGLAQTLHATGDLAVVLFDFRGHGLSEDRPFTYGALEVRDVRAVVDWAERRAQAPTWLVGWSAGGAIALLYAAEDDRIERVVAINPFASMADMAELRRPFFVRRSVYERALRIAERRAGFQIADVDPERASERSRAKVLLIVGEADETIPPDHSHRLARALGARATLWSLPGLGHDDWWRHPEFSERVLAFFGP